MVSLTISMIAQISSMVIAKFTEKNYLAWKDQILPMIENVDLLNHIADEMKELKQLLLTSEGTEETNPAYISWRRDDQLLRSLISGTLIEEVHLLVIGLKTAREIWQCLAETFAGTSQERELGLIHQLQTIRKGNQGITDYLKSVKIICDELYAMQKPVYDRDKVFWTINGLGSRYDSFSDAIMARPLLPTFSQLLASLLALEQRTAMNTTDKNLMSESHAYVGQRQNKSNRGSKTWNKRQSFDSKERGFTQASHQPHTQSEPNKEVARGPNPPCQICKKPGHDALRYWHRFNHSYQAEEIPQALAAMAITDPYDPEWIPDTGATSHMTNNPGILHSISPYNGSDVITVGNGNTLPISHIGSTTLPTSYGKLKVDNILVVPSITKNLLSVGQLTDEYSCLFEFTSNGFVIKDQKSGRILAKVTRDGGLYSLAGNTTNQALYSSRQQKTSEDLWHQRLGQPQLKIVSFLHSKNFISVTQWNKNGTICSSCQLGRVYISPHVLFDETLLLLSNKSATISDVSLQEELASMSSFMEFGDDVPPSAEPDVPSPIEPALPHSADLGPAAVAESPRTTPTHFGPLVLDPLAGVAGPVAATVSAEFGSAGVAAPVVATLPNRVEPSEVDNSPTVEPSEVSFPGITIATVGDALEHASATSSARATSLFPTASIDPVDSSNITAATPISDPHATTAAPVLPSSGPPMQPLAPHVVADGRRLDPPMHSFSGALDGGRLVIDLGPLLPSPATMSLSPRNTASCVVTPHPGHHLHNNIHPMQTRGKSRAAGLLHSLSSPSIPPEPTTIQSAIELKSSSQEVAAGSKDPTRPVCNNSGKPYKSCIPTSPLKGEVELQ
ncbi:hypothetical protein HHK36_024347 [Tetracentron sinense]|uniref:Uncharacterized protein n=1 Tax=Tetracentron sinense TaxID=13715 RepID=A0A834YNW3_TETSI|nr:hypothetical protein HHK36_024347 [Tetracentron sinense]